MYCHLANIIISCLGDSATNRHEIFYDGTNGSNTCKFWLSQKLLSPLGDSPIRKNMYFLPGDSYLVPISVKICMMLELCAIRGFLHFWWRYL